jgi:hypothetical protein
LLAPPPLFRKSDTIGKVHFHAFVGYYHAVLGKNTQHRLISVSSFPPALPVKTEIYHARQQEVAENRGKLFPISLVDFDAIRQWKAFDADIGKDRAREVREYFIPDFSQWKEHDAYQKAFDRLLRDLKAVAS